MKRFRDQLLDGAAGRSAGWERLWFAALAAIVVGYALLGSLHPVYGDDLFFLLNDARWLVEHHEIPQLTISRTPRKGSSGSTRSAVACFSTDSEGSAVMRRYRGLPHWRRRQRRRCYCEEDR